MDASFSDMPRVSAVELFATRGPWKTKSNGILRLRCAVPYDALMTRYFHYPEGELRRVPQDIRGFRVYTVEGLRRGEVGGMEFHRIRVEMVFVLRGRLRWTCEDMFGGKLETILDSSNGVWMQPFINHTYEVLDDDSCFEVIANTLYNPQDPSTHDTYSMSAFRDLQACAG